jgi:hemoglobin
MERPGTLESLDDIKLLVNEFYRKVQADELIGPVFAARIGDHWQPHLEKMYTFWQTLLLEEHSYTGRPFPPHATLPIAGEHFERWLTLFTETTDQLFTGEKAAEAKWRAARIAETFQAKLHYFRTHPGAIH